MTANERELGACPGHGISSAPCHRLPVAKNVFCHGEENNPFWAAYVRTKLSGLITALQQAAVWSASRTGLRAPDFSFLYFF